MQSKIEEFIQLGNYQQAEQICLAALTHQEDNATLWHYLAMCHFFAKRFEACIAAYQRAIDLKPWFAWTSAFNQSQAFLITGQLEKGFALFESRLLDPRLPKYPVPKWKGEDISGKRLLVHQDEGFGDAIQFLRFIPCLQRYNCEVSLCLKPELRPLFQHLGVPLLTERTFDCDLQVETGSLPFCFKTSLTTIPPPVSIVSKRRARKGRIGLVWQASIGTNKDAGGEGIAGTRSLPSAATLEPLLTLPHVHYVALQKKIFPHDAAFLSRYNVEQPPIDSFLDTVRLLEECELVISVDTSVPHLSASMGIPTWILIPYDGSWRWLLNPTDSPWYPTARLFRQCRHEVWEDPIRDVKEMLCRQTL